MLRIVPHTVPRVGRSDEHFPDGFELHLVQPPRQVKRAWVIKAAHVSGLGEQGAVAVAIEPDPEFLETPECALYGKLCDQYYQGSGRNLLTEVLFDLLLFFSRA